MTTVLNVTVASDRVSRSWLQHLHAPKSTPVQGRDPSLWKFTQSRRPLLLLSRFTTWTNQQNAFQISNRQVRNRIMHEISRKKESAQMKSSTTSCWEVCKRILSHVDSYTHSHMSKNIWTCDCDEENKFERTKRKKNDFLSDRTHSYSLHHFMLMVHTWKLIPYHNCL